MGYTTEFEGYFTLDKPLSEPHAAYLLGFCRSRRMKRLPSVTSKLPDPLRANVGLPLGDEGGYFIGTSNDDFGQAEAPGILDHNEPPNGQPGLWCQWIPSKDRAGIEWDCGEKFYEYVEWLKYLIEHFLKPWGYVLNGEVKWFGENRSDVGLLVVKDNKVTRMVGQTTYYE